MQIVGGRCALGFVALSGDNGLPYAPPRFHTDVGDIELPNSPLGRQMLSMSAYAGTTEPR
jgi:hypothetical protein